MEDLINQGNRFMSDGEVQSALDCFIKYTESNPPTAEVFMKIGHCKKSLLNFENAVEYYKKSLNLQADSFEVLYNCGDSYLLLGQIENAVETLDKVFEIAERKGGHVLKLAKAKRNEALGALLNRKGASLMKDNRLDDAYETFLQAIELNPLDKRNYANIGVIFLQHGDQDNGIDWFKKALKIDSKYVRGYFNLGTIYLKNGWYMQAIILYQKALEIEPEGRDSRDIRINLEAAETGLNDSKQEFLEYLLLNKKQISNEYIAKLANGVCDERIYSVDTVFLKSGKLEFSAYGDRSKFRISEANGNVILNKIS